MWSSRLLPEAFARAFAPLPSQTIWEWADQNVWLENKESAEPGPYRSVKTPWTRRLQELIQRPVMFHYDFGAARWVTVSVSEVNEIKSSQSGVSEAALNGVRYKANFRPCNVIYAIDTREEAKEIGERLLPSLRKLDTNIFTGDDDDVGTYALRLRAMNIWFYGSFSTGKFANKQAPLVIVDEQEEHGQSKGDTSSGRNLASRKKTAPHGLQINISKPKLEGGPIHKGWLRGNQEEFHIRCPHCGYLQPLTFNRNEDSKSPRETPFSEEFDEVQDEQSGSIVAVLPRPMAMGCTRKIKTGRLVFEHCKDLLGRWDKLRILRETYYECGSCLQKIEEHQKPELLASAQWLPTAIGTPGIVSQHINDLYIPLNPDPAASNPNSWGHIVLEYLDAKREGRRELQGFYNHRLGQAWREQAHKFEANDILVNIAGREGDRCPPYRRGTIPFIPRALLLGGDVGGNYAKWAVLAITQDLQDAAVIDWGTEIDPDAIAELMNNGLWPCEENGKRMRLTYGFIDAKFRKTETYRACLAVTGRRLIPTAGHGGAAARSVKLFSYNQIPQYPRSLKRLDYNDREAKDELYLERMKKQRRRVWLPLDVEADPEFMGELTAEELIEDVNGELVWNPHPGANHYGDCVKDGITGLRWLTRQNQPITEPPV